MLLYTGTILLSLCWLQSTGDSHLFLFSMELLLAQLALSLLLHFNRLPKLIQTALDWLLLLFFLYRHLWTLSAPLNAFQDLAVAVYASFLHLVSPVAALVEPFLAILCSQGIVTHIESFLSEYSPRPLRHLSNESLHDRMEVDSMECMSPLILYFNDVMVLSLYSSIRLIERLNDDLLAVSLNDIDCCFRRISTPAAGPCMASTGALHEHVVDDRRSYYAGESGDLFPTASRMESESFERKCCGDGGSCPLSTFSLMVLGQRWCSCSFFSLWPIVGG